MHLFPKTPEPSGDKLFLVVQRVLSSPFVNVCLCVESDSRFMRSERERAQYCGLVV